MQVTTLTLSQVVSLPFALS